MKEQSPLTPRYEVVEQLKSARKAQNVTQEVLAERVGTKKSNISRFESGCYNPSLDFLIKVADSLGKQIQIRIRPHRPAIRLIWNDCFAAAHSF